jgi:hypothetical protein
MQITVYLETRKRTIEDAPRESEADDVCMTRDPMAERRIDSRLDRQDLGAAGATLRSLL